MLSSSQSLNMADTQNAIVVSDFKPDIKDIHNTVQLKKIPKTEAHDGKVLLHILLRPINPIDHITLQGNYPVFTLENSPAVPGTEAVAEVVSGSKQFKKGQRVGSKHWAGIAEATGTWQEYINVKEDALVAVPDELTMEQAASFWINPMTTVGMLRRLDVPKGEWIIQTAAGSSVGRMVISVAKHKGIKTINVVRRSEQKQELLDLGADVVIATDKEEIVPIVEKVTEGKGVYGGMDAVAGDMTATLIESVRKGGRILIYGLLSGLTLTASAQLILFGQREIVGFTMPVWFYGNSKEVQEEALKETFDLLAKKIIDVPAKKTFALKDVGNAIKESLQSGVGKVYLSN